ncbi:TPA: hypothetical protein DDW69_02375 [candidate division CPR2 bacterium]|uniref:Uncharacterized protein n=1 Tax=candidate division CPR2 bacterium GW2011_GWC1_41_48 TaxID=1618344 RepID=A0A0G0WCS8_UNCC2|nr:MAG: hypothetical protein UT47_C0001G0277 [candidate division CPR2 bacterium GW2011_GWC2_39_35]KKR28869.1 MAG: hypothetical protein UT59_C0017G0003 [candidate division CPR2 bacterium GW2011_GWD1_39_7]KKR29158.1 MAG: hypothetical protein UT60_C0006G0021 [candidate division CPR2 bacterium GW2011_GWD2_39_7]KKS09872.1 MAG: hypothetical protein UU65_C0001G0277 [candidate division CPR2 bacterium GW2011_GWC1_41_48]OGB61497.1 MAG: hypothetical protein A2Y27_02485 [candidate division CPR2 bacterium G
MNESKVISKINEMIVVETAVLNNYQIHGELAPNEEILNKFVSFANTSKELLATLSGMLEALGGELIDNVESISYDLNEAFEAVIEAGVFSNNEALRVIYEAYLLEALNYRNWSILKELSEEEEDERFTLVKEAKEKADKTRKWLKDKIEELSLEDLK